MVVSQCSRILDGGFRGKQVYTAAGMHEYRHEKSICISGWTSQMIRYHKITINSVSQNWVLQPGTELFWERSLVTASCQPYWGQGQVQSQIFSKLQRLRHRHLLNLPSCVMHQQNFKLCIHLYACIPTSNLQTSVNIVALKLSQIASQKDPTMIQAQEKDSWERKSCAMLHVLNRYLTSRRPPCLIKTGQLDMEFLEISKYLQDDNSFLGKFRPHSRNT